MRGAVLSATVATWVSATACGGAQPSEPIIAVALGWTVEHTKNENPEVTHLGGTHSGVSFQRIDGPLTYRYGASGERGYFAMRADGGVVISAWEDSIDAVAVSADVAPPDENVARAEAVCKNLQKAGWQVENLVPTGATPREYAAAEIRRRLPSVGARFCSASLDNAFTFVSLGGMGGSAQGLWRLRLDFGLKRHPANEPARLRYEEENRRKPRSEKPS